MPHQIDDRYTEGVWYDLHNGDFAKIQESDDGELVELVNPETSDVYWDMPVEEWVEEEQHNFRKVPEGAVEDPVATVNRALRIMSRNDVEELAAIPLEAAIGLRYARQQVNIMEDNQ